MQQSGNWGWNGRVLSGRIFPALLSIVAILASASATFAAITEAKVLVVYNSASPDATALKNTYLAAHPGIPANHVLDLNDASLLVPNLTYADFITKIRTPIRNHLTSLGPADLQSILSIVLMRPFPHRIWDTDNLTVGDNPSALQAEFIPPPYLAGGQADATCASVDAELVLLWQNLETGEAGGNMDSRSDNLIDNPYHQSAAEIQAFTRVNIQAQKTLASFGGAGITWASSGAGAAALTSGDLYLVCRIDAPTLAAAQASITRAQGLYANKATQIILLDSYDVALAGANGALDNGVLYTSGDPFYAGPDYSDTRTVMQGQGWTVRFDATTNFIDPADEPRTLIGFATYGENHSLFGAGDDPVGNGTYPSSGYKYARGAIFNPLESYSGRDLNGLGQSIPQGQVGDFIAAGGTFAVGNVWEPFSFSLADNEFLMQRMLVNQRTWAEAAYSAIPVLSWQQVVLGDPLGRFAAILNDAGLPKGDMDGSGAVDGRDIHWFVQVMTQGISGYRTMFPTLDPIARGDFNNDLSVDAADMPAFLAALLAP